MSRILTVLFVFPIFVSGVRTDVRAESRSTPTWVPWTLAGVTAAAAGVYLYEHTLHGQTAAQTPMQKVRDLIEYVATPEERKELDALADGDQIYPFLDRFYLRRDPTPGTPENEFRREHERRFTYAEDAFREANRGWRTDRGRAYILYGPPAEIYHYPMIDVRFGPGRQWKAAEIWEYPRAAGSNRLPPILSDFSLFQTVFHAAIPVRGRSLFVFADLAGGGSYQQVFSTEAGECVDPLIYDGPTEGYGPESGE
jgi:GWxTD domain-containing protein